MESQVANCLAGRIYKRVGKHVAWMWDGAGEMGNALGDWLQSAHFHNSPKNPRLHEARPHWEKRGRLAVSMGQNLLPAGRSHPLASTVELEKYWKY